MTFALEGTVADMRLLLLEYGAEEGKEEKLRWLICQDAANLAHHRREAFRCSGAPDGKSNPRVHAKMILTTQVRAQLFRGAKGHPKRTLQLHMGGRKRLRPQRCDTNSTRSPLGERFRNFGASSQNVSQIMLFAYWNCYFWD